jgi:hypothetical protein
MQVRPVRLNKAIAWLFMVGSACFVVGSVPAYVHAVGETADAVTFFVGSIFFTAASYAQLVQTQSPAMTGTTEKEQDAPAPVRLWSWLPNDRSYLAAVTQLPGTLFFNVSTFAALAHNATVRDEVKHVWRPDFFGSTMFLVASAFGVLAVGSSAFTGSIRSVPWWIAWLNMVGSILFMVSAIASYVLPSGELVDNAVSVAGTLLGAVCFLGGAALMLPAWRQQTRALSSRLAGEP